MTSLGSVITYDEPYHWSEEMPSEWRRRLRARSADEMLAELADEWQSEFPLITGLYWATPDHRQILATQGICIACCNKRANRILHCDECNQKMLDRHRQKRAMKQVA